MEAQPALVGAQRGVELHPETAVDLHPSGVVGPRHPEDDLAFRLADPFQHRGLGVLGIALHDRPEGVEDLADGLMKLGLPRIPGDDLVENLGQIRFHWHPFVVLSASFVLFARDAGHVPPPGR